MSLHRDGLHSEIGSGHCNEEMNHHFLHIGLFFPLLAVCGALAAFYQN